MCCLIAGNCCKFINYKVTKSWIAEIDNCISSKPLNRLIFLLIYYRAINFAVKFVLTLFELYK